MPTKKQRRRQQKNRRHEWEYVYVDDEGHEVEVDPAALRPDKNDRDKERSRAASSSRPATARGRRGRTIEPPSWRRVFKRALIFAPIFVVALVLLNRNQSVATSVAPAVFLLVFFIPFSYFTDWLAYRTYQKRIARTETTAKPKTR